MSNVKYSKSKLLNAKRAVSLKSRKLEVGSTLKVVEVVTPDYARDSDINLDNLLCELDGQTIRVPVREYANMKVAGGKAYDTSENEDEVIFPTSIRIVESKDRVITRNGELVTVYPIQAYVDGAAQIQSQSFDFDALVASGLTEEGQQMDPVQDYTIEVSF